MNEGSDLIQALKIQKIVKIILENIEKRDLDIAYCATFLIAILVEPNRETKIKLLNELRKKFPDTCAYIESLIENNEGFS
jgi:transcriptional regulator